MKSNLTKLIVTLCLTSLHVLSANAQNTQPQIPGGGSSNGGNAYVTPESASFLDLVKKATLTVYDMESSPGYKKLLSVINTEAFRNTTILQPNFTLTLSPYERIERSLKEKLTFYITEEEIPLLEDKGLVIFSVELQKGHIERLAVQHKYERKVYINARLLRLMRKEDLKPNKKGENEAAFLMHEAFINIYNEGLFLHESLKSTEMIGNIVNTAFGKNPLLPQFTKITLAKTLTKAQIPTYKDQIDFLKPIPVLDKLPDYASNDVYVFDHSQNIIIKLVPKPDSIWKRSVNEAGTLIFLRSYAVERPEGAISVDASILFAIRNPRPEDYLQVKYWIEVNFNENNEPDTSLVNKDLETLYLFGGSNAEKAISLWKKTK